MSALDSVIAQGGFNGDHMGGGWGWLARQHGLASARLRAVDEGAQEETGEQVRRERDRERQGGQQGRAGAGVDQDRQRHGRDDVAEQRGHGGGEEDAIRGNRERHAEAGC